MHNKISCDFFNCLTGRFLEGSGKSGAWLGVAGIMWPTSVSDCLVMPPSIDKWIHPPRVCINRVDRLPISFLMSPQSPIQHPCGALSKKTWPIAFKCLFPPKKQLLPNFRRSRNKFCPCDINRYIVILDKGSRVVKNGQLTGFFRSFVLGTLGTV